MANTCNLSIIIVSWNVWDYLRDCLTSLERASDATSEPTLRVLSSSAAPNTQLCFEVVLVDAASEDATPALIPSLFPWVRLLTPGQNVGFSRGNNLGYEASRGQILFFLNPDTLVEAHAVVTLWTALQAQPAVGVAGPRLMRTNGEQQDSRRRFPNPVTGFFESTWLGRSWPGNPWSQYYHCRNWPRAFAQGVDWLEGAALMIRRKTFAGVGGFDERFFMYSEELDLCRRIRTAGWRIHYVPAATIIHHGGSSSAQVPAQTHIIFNTSKVLYYRKHFGPLWAECMRYYLLTEFALQLLGETAKLLMGHKPALRQQRIQAYLQVLTSRLFPTSPTT